MRDYYSERASITKIAAALRDSAEPPKGRRPAGGSAEARRANVIFVIRARTSSNNIIRWQDSRVTQCNVPAFVSFSCWFSGESAGIWPGGPGFYSRLGRFSFLISRDLENSSFSCRLALVVSRYEFRPMGGRYGNYGPLEITK